MRLTPRERSIVAELLTAAEDKEIAYALGLTQGTIKVRMHGIRRKLGLRNRVALALWAERSGAWARLPDADAGA